MTLSRILNSPSQRKQFLFVSFLVILICMIGILAISLFAPDNKIWDSLNNFLISMAASAVFAVLAGLFIFYFFIDPAELAAEQVVLPEDIGPALRSVAEGATEYKIYVRTGRHFRAEILPALAEAARRRRQPISIQVILLDFRDDSICCKYAKYRRSASFDHKLWDVAYVQGEVMATIIKLSRAASENDLLRIDLFLSKRLSTFRIEGSQEEIIVTREDPKDSASRYVRTHRDFSAFVNEFNWIKDGADHVNRGTPGMLPANMQAIFGELPIISTLEERATVAADDRSPYAR